MGDLVNSVRNQVQKWGLENTAYAVAAVAVAQLLEHPKTSPTAAAMLHGRLKEYLDVLAAQAPPEEVHDSVTELAEKVKKLRAVQ